MTSIILKGIRVIFRLIKNLNSKESLVRRKIKPILYKRIYFINLVEVRRAGVTVCLARSSSSSLSILHDRPQGRSLRLKYNRRRGAARPMRHFRKKGHRPRRETTGLNPAPHTHPRARFTRRRNKLTRIESASRVA